MNESRLGENMICFFYKLRQSVKPKIWLVLRFSPGTTAVTDNSENIHIHYPSCKVKPPKNELLDQEEHFWVGEKPLNTTHWSSRLWQESHSWSPTGNRDINASLVLNYLLPFTRQTLQRYRLIALLVYIHRYQKKKPGSVFSSEMPLHLATLPYKTDPLLQAHSTLFCSVLSAPHQDYCRNKNLLYITYLGKCTLLSTGQKTKQTKKSACFVTVWLIFCFSFLFFWDS